MQIRAIKSYDNIKNNNSLSFKELKMADIQRQLARREIAPKNPDDILWYKIVKEKFFQNRKLTFAESVKAYLDKFVFDKRINTYYKDFFTRMQRVTRWHAKTVWVSPARLAASCMFNKYYTDNPEYLRKNLCELAANPNVDASEYCFDESGTFTSEIVCKLLKDYEMSKNFIYKNRELDNQKLDIAKDFIKTVTQREDYNSASRDLYAILANNKEFSEEMYDIINMLMEHKSFDPNYIDNYYDSRFDKLQQYEGLFVPELALAYCIANYEADMKDKIKNNIPDNAHFFEKLCSHPDFDLAKATDKMGLDLKSNEDLYKIFSNWEKKR